MNKWIQLIVFVCIVIGLFYLFVLSEQDDPALPETETMNIDVITDIPDYVYDFESYTEYCDSEYYSSTDDTSLTKSGRKYTMYRRGAYTARIEWYESSTDCSVTVLSPSDINTQVATFGSVD